MVSILRSKYDIATDAILYLLMNILNFETSSFCLCKNVIHQNNVEMNVKTE